MNPQPDSIPWELLITPLTLILLSALRQVVPRIPGPVVVILAPAIGAGLDLLGSYSGAWESSGAAGAALGGLATWFHQLGKQTSQQLKVPQPSDPGPDQAFEPPAVAPNAPAGYTPAPNIDKALGELSKPAFEALVQDLRGYYRVTLARDSEQWFSITYGPDAAGRKLPAHWPVRYAYAVAEFGPPEPRNKTVMFASHKPNPDPSEPCKS